MFREESYEDQKQPRIEYYGTWLIFATNVYGSSGRLKFFGHNLIHTYVHHRLEIALGLVVDNLALGYMAYCSNNYVELLDNWVELDNDNSQCHWADDNEDNLMRVLKFMSVF